VISLTIIKKPRAFVIEIALGIFVFSNVVGEVKTRLTINLQSAEETIKF
jgi:hypothetical protein